MINHDCLLAVFEFLDTTITIQINRQSAVRCFPKKIKLKNYKQYHSFIRWSTTFDTSNLVELTQVFTDIWQKHDYNIPVGWAPPSVKTLRICDCDYNRVLFPPDVTEISIGKCSDTQIVIPPSVKILTLDTWFEGVIREFPDGLEQLTIKNWCWDNVDGFHDLTLPDTIKILTITRNSPLSLTKWPRDLETLVIEEEQYLWYEFTFPPIPEGVKVFRFGHLVVPEEDQSVGGYDQWFGTDDQDRDQWYD
jgi:hypothetical protein